METLIDTQRDTVRDTQREKTDSVPLTFLDATHLGELACNALEQEALLTPKPALVDSRGCGAHTDMDITLLLASARCLKPYFTQMAVKAHALALGSELRQHLGEIGRQAEQTMLQTTYGVNTHKGAIWALGILVAAAANSGAQYSGTQYSSTQDSGTQDSLLDKAAQLACLTDTGLKTVYLSHGLQVRHQYGLSGAKEEAQQGFPHVRTLGLPMLQQSRARGDDESHARLNALLAIMTRLSDTCVLSRAGLDGLQTMQQGASAVLNAGGVGRLQGRVLLNELEQRLLQLNASPGGAADLLAATLFIDSLSGFSSEQSI